MNTYKKDETRTWKVLWKIKVVETQYGERVHVGPVGQERRDRNHRKGPCKEEGKVEYPKISSTVVSDVKIDLQVDPFLSEGSSEYNDYRPKSKSTR